MNEAKVVSVVFEVLGRSSSIDFSHQASSLAATIPHHQVPHDLLHAITRTASDGLNEKTLPALSKLLAISAFTTQVAELFSPLLVDLCARWLEDEFLDEITRLEALAFISEPCEEIFPLVKAFLSRPSLSKGPLGFLVALQPAQIAALPGTDLERILLTYYRLLHAEQDIPKLFDWASSPLTALLSASHPDLAVRALAIECWALHERATEEEKIKTSLELLGPPGEVDIPTYYGDSITDASIQPRQIDGWLLPFLESVRVTQLRAKVQSQSSPPVASPPIPSNLLHPRIANVGGILLFRHTPDPVPPSSLIETPGTLDVLKTMALQLSRRLPTLITSPPGSGKSLFIQHIATLLFPLSVSPNQIVNIHLSDTSLDAKSLLGSYSSSTTVPGTFEWVEGTLVRAMRAGKWLVLKDIDRASTEILGMVMPLVESLGWTKGIGQRAAINVPGRGRVEAADTFMLFATRSVGPTSFDSSGKPSFPSPSFLGNHHWNEVQANSPSYEEQELILSSRFSKLAGAPLRVLLDVWKEIQAILRSSPKASGGVAGTPRDVGPRDLEKWVRRVDSLLSIGFSNDDSTMDVDGAETTDARPAAEKVFKHPSVREEIFDEARDVFFGFLHPSSPALGHFALVVGGLLGLTETTAQWRLTNRTPEYQVEKNPLDGRVVAVRVGHTKLLATPSSGPPTPMKPFALHRPSLTLLSRLCAAVPHSEPVLLVGETGTGKTTAIQHLAQLLSRPLTVINLSNQTASSDLLGGFKPIDARVPGTELQRRFVELFTATFSAKKNEGFLDGVGSDVRSSKWKRAVKIWKGACASARTKFEASRRKESAITAKELEGSDSPRKRRKLEEETISTNASSEQDWRTFEEDVNTFEAQHILAKSKFVFTFVEGPLIKALRQGHWVLLDEINLASPETLEAVTPLLQSPTSSITLTEQGSLTPIPRHLSFRIFASMNPATDVGKKDLPPNLRLRFTELWVPPPDEDKEALLAIVKQYIGHCSLADPAAIMDVAEFYTEVRRLTESRVIADGSNRRPHFSMRTLARALTFTADVTPVFGLRRALWEGCLMAFTMTLDAKSTDIVKPLAERWILRGVKNVSSVLSSVPMLPKGLSRDDVVQVGPFWLQRGPLLLQNTDDYILTPSVQRKLIDLSRIILTRRFPVLIEGPTSAGKTSAIQYLAQRTGHRFVRINNHERTDIQEYLGTYVSDPDSGKLVFHDGLLVRALREGHWIVLDELNLAPTDVLESLNRLLDDNRELVIPETQEIVRPHPSFMLFATQNPAGLYGGRKVLSRAFRNRFLEVHFTDVPQAELEVILSERCKIPPSRAQRIVAVFEELQKRRQTGRVFETKQGFATLRDLFRWANRDWKDKDGLTNQDLAEDGYMLLAERARNADDKAVVKEVLENVLKVKIDEDAMYRIDVPGADLRSKVGLPYLPSGLVWTQAFQRLFVLVSSALKHNEPVLLVGETGCGKTSVCEHFARAHGQTLYSLNCHQNTETADLLGGQRPVRNRASLRAEAIQDAQALLQESGLDVDNLTEPDAVTDAILKASIKKTIPPSARESLRVVLEKFKRADALFEWHDGPLVDAMRTGGVFLLDEISLADDSVLERLNSVLEPGRTLTLAEKGGWDIDRLEVSASPSFKLVATMNPGGDYGKKELSPALRNRFTEIWVPLVELRSDKQKIIENMWGTPTLQSFSTALLEFCDWFSKSLGDDHAVGLRDIIAWAEFSNAANTREPSIQLGELFHHAAHMTLLDGLASLPQTTTFSSLALAELESAAACKLNELVPSTLAQRDSITTTDNIFRIGQFGIVMGPHQLPNYGFNLMAPTTTSNAARVIRACQVLKPILLEGSPGVGKSSLVAALATFAGHRLCRINLSDQTDLMDLYGSDLPVEGGKPGEFVWKDAAFLRALQEGDWVLLDEMNLAPQAVLEGLNAVLDHRGTVYIPELGRSFTRHPNFRIFAAQNPLHQGGGRKGLPKSFLNRFTKVYVRELSPTDYHLICAHLFPGFSSETLTQMITFNARLHEEVMLRRSFAREGSPWEFNLRDLLRWLSLLHLKDANHPESPTEFIRSVYLQRFRNEADRLRVWEIYTETFNIVHEMPSRPSVSVTPRHCQVGHTVSERLQRSSGKTSFQPLRKHTTSLEAISDAVRQGSLVIISGRKQSGKTSLVRLFASLFGVDLQEFSMHPAVDTGDLLGSFEQLPHQPSDSGNPQARFGWIDGPLVTAIKQGQWLLLDNANLCNPSVLDRLNSLCETGGSLVLSERGLVNGEVQVLTPHPDFRLFMVMDPQHGELSRAMRNRGIEVAVDPIDDPEDAIAVLARARLIGPHFRLSDVLGTKEGGTIKHLRDLYQLSSQLSLGSEQEISSLVEHSLRASTANNFSLTQRLLQFLALQDPGTASLVLSNSSHEMMKPIMEMSTTLKGQIAQTRGVPSAFLAFQPIDILLNADIVAPILAAAAADESRLAPTVVMDGIECLLRQANASKLVNLSSPPRSALDRSYAILTGRLSQADEAKGLKEIYPLIKAVQTVGAVTLSRLSANGYQSASKILRNTNSILAFTQHLVAVTQHRELDYSAIQTIMSWFRELGSDVPGPLEEVFLLAAQLESTVAVSRGHGMDRIWRSRLSRVLPQELNSGLRELDELSLTQSQEGRQLAFDLMAVATLGRDVAASAAQVQTMRSSISFIKDNAYAILGPSSSEESYIVTLELRLLQRSNLIQAANRITRTAIKTPYYSLLRLTPIQHAAWNNEAGSKVSSTLRAAMFTSWCKALWSIEKEDGMLGLGPAMLLKPVLVQETLYELMRSTDSLSKLPEYESRLDRVTSLARMELEDAPVGRNRLLLNAFIDQLGVFLEAFAASYEGGTFALIQHDLRAWSSSVSQSESWSQPSDLITTISSNKDAHFVSAFQHILQPHLANLHANLNLIAHVGKAFVALGLVTLELYVPDTPLDPIVSHRCALEFWRGEESRLVSRIEVNRRAEWMETGNATNATLKELERRLEGVRARLKGIAMAGGGLGSSGNADVGREPDLKKLHALFNEVHLFLREVLSPEKVWDLGDGLERVGTFLGSVQGFLARLERGYEALGDVALPVVQAVELVRFGVGMGFGSGREGDVAVHGFVEALVNVPRALASAVMQTVDVENVVKVTSKTSSRVEVLLHSLRVVAEDSTPRLDVVGERYDQLLRLWMDDREAERREAEEKGSLYKARKVEETILSDEEREEREFRRLFPKWGEDDQDDVEEVGGKPKSGRAMDDQAVRTVYQLHLRMFEDGAAVELEGVKCAVALLEAGDSGGGGHELDLKTTCARVIMLQDRLQRLREGGSSTFDFYRDANVPEVRKAVVLLEKTIARLDALLAEWPEQLVLRHLKDRAEDILRLPMDSPIAKVLAALERLLLHTEDWERYAHKGNSLREERGEITGLIVEWRRMELSCWRRLLDSQGERFEVEGVAVWWFRLYEAVVVAVRGEVDGLSPVLDGFMVASPLGQYSARLRLLHSFAEFVHRGGGEEESLRKVEALLRSTHAFFKQFEGEVVRKLSENRRKLDDEVKGFVKLASWRDVNVHALKASAEKTHRQLHKSVRKLKEVLQSPVEPIVSGMLFETSVKEEGVIDSAAAAEMSVEVGEDALVKVKTLVEVVRGKVHPFVSLQVSTRVEEMAVGLLETAHELAATQIPTKGDKEETVKAVKALSARKRKAMADAMKDLKDAGLPANLKPEVLLAQQSRSKLMTELKPLPTSSVDSVKADKYHNRLVHLLPQLRQTLNNHHQDINTRDLQRAVGFVESGFAAALNVRRRLSSSLDTVGRVKNTMERIRGSRRLVSLGEDGRKQMDDLHDTLGRLCTCLSQVEQHSKVILTTQTLPDGYSQLQQDLKRSLDDVEVVRKSVNLTRTPFITSDETQHLNRASSEISRAYKLLNSWSTQSTQWNHLFLNLLNWLRPIHNRQLALTEFTPTLTDTPAETRITNAILVITQNLLSQAEASSSDPTDIDDFIRTPDRVLRRTGEALQGDLVLSLLEDFLPHVSSETSVGPYLQQYALVVDAHLEELARWCKALYKLAYISCSVLRTVADKGFCKPPDTEEGEGEAKGEGKLEEGTGLGEGTGLKNVSEEIEDESQVEGLRGEEDEEQQKRNEGQDGEDEDEDKAIEMKDDFGGEMEDVDDRDKGEKDEDEDEDEDEPTPEDQVGNLDPLDPNAVDEKMWGEKGGPEDQQQNDERDQDQAPPQDQEGGETEMTAREEDDRRKPQPKDQNQSTKDQGPEETKPDEEGEEEEGPDLDAPAPDLGAKMDEHVPEGDVLDLPEDMDIGGDDGQDEDGQGEDDAEMDLGDLEGDEEDVDKEPESKGEDEMRDEEGGGEDDRKEAQEEGEDQQHHPELDQAARPDIDRTAAGDATVSAEEKEKGSAPSGEARKEDGGEAGEKQEQEQPDASKEKDKAQNEDENQPHEGQDKEDAPGQAEREGRQAAQQEETDDDLTMPNPVRNLGNAMKDIQRRVQEIMRPTSSTPSQPQPQSQPEIDNDAPVEYANDEDEEMQALGPSNPEDEAARLRDLKISEEEKVVNNVPPMDDLDVEMEDEERRVGPLEKRLPKMDDAKMDGGDPNAEPAVMEERVRGDKVDEDVDPDGRAAKVEEEEEPPAPPESEQIELALRNWTASSPHRDASELWRLYSTFTQDLSTRLCEQLRLILEPTRATRLKGDYRTGKRLNMKKIVSYVASEFTKDKIWLRRTRPSAREYQVLIALDDSRSMKEGEGRAVRLAFETLVMVVRALGRLEVGDVGVVRFGETVDVLHGFDGAPFTDAEGGKVLGAFGFEQGKTDVLGLVERSIEVLTEARERKATGSASSSELWQLEIIISDGICQDHERLRALLRKAKERRIMIVFLIVDSLRTHNATASIAAGTSTQKNATQNSIVTMNQVSYKNVDGKMELTMERYLDTFPFEYYVVLRNVEALPEVLSGTLKQFFERSAEM